MSKSDRPQILVRETRWNCPNCQTRDVTHEAQPHTRFHTCPGLKGLTAPLVEFGTDCQVRAVEREDYIGTDTPTLDGEGRPVSAVETVRADGSNDVAAFAGCADVRMIMD
jgi:hypothetical protein